FGNVAHGGGIEAALAEEIERRREDLLACHLALLAQSGGSRALLRGRRRVGGVGGRGCLGGPGGGVWFIDDDHGIAPLLERVQIMLLTSATCQDVFEHV